MGKPPDLLADHQGSLRSELLIDTSAAVAPIRLTCNVHACTCVGRCELPQHMALSNCPSRAAVCWLHMWPTKGWKSSVTDSQLACYFRKEQHLFPCVCSMQDGVPFLQCSKWHPKNVSVRCEGRNWLLDLQDYPMGIWIAVKLLSS